MKKTTIILSAAASIALTASGLADGPKDNIATNVRPVPPPGVEVPAADAEAMHKGLSELKALIEDLKKTKGGNAKERDLPSPGGGSKNGTSQVPLLVADLLPDVEIYPQGRRLGAALQRVQQRRRRSTAALELLAEGKTARGSAEERRGAVDATDGPRGARLSLEDRRLGAALRPGDPRELQLDGAAHAARLLVSRPRRDAERAGLRRPAAARQPGQIAPRDTLVLHLYGRYCCANKFAGEVDLFEALEHAKKFYRDRRRPHRGARLLDGRRGGLAVRRALRRACGARRIPARASRRRRSSSACFQSEDVSRRAVVSEEALALVRLHRLRAEPLQLPDDRLQRRDRQAEAGRRRDGARVEEGRTEPDAHHRPADGAQDSSRQRWSRSSGGWRTSRRWAANTHAARGAFHDLDAALQPDELGDGRRDWASTGSGRGWMR